MNDDLINRKIAYAMLSEYFYLKTDKHHKDLWDALSRVPSAQPEQLWIPVTEQLPKENGEYMITLEYYWQGETGRMLTSARYTKTKGWHLSSGKVVAWMHLPTPWKGDSR